MSPAAAGDAANLFPTLSLSPSPGGPAQQASTRPVANTSALPEDAPIADAQLAGLAALALAFVLTVTRLSIRCRPAAAKADGPDTAVNSGIPAKSDPPAKPGASQDADQPGKPESADKPDGNENGQEPPSTDADAEKDGE